MDRLFNFKYCPKIANIAKAREIVDSAILDKISSSLAGRAKDPTKITILDIEILQICSLLMTYMKEEFSEFKLKRELIAYGWYMLKTEDKILKNIAYVFVTKFIVTIGLPDTQKVIQV